MDNPLISMVGDSPIIGKCPECETGLIIKTNHNGRESASCNNKPICTCQPMICPKCKNGILLLKQETNQFICSNKDCSFTARRCPRCDGYLIEHEKDGRFWGCSNFRETSCRYIEPILT